MFTKTRIIAGAIACFLLLGAASCSTDQRAAHDGRPILDFDGDSITFQSTADINAHFGTIYDVGIKAVIGMGAISAAPMTADQAADGPAIEVINFGTNDAASIAGQNLGHETVDAVDAALSAYNAEFPSSCVVFVTVNAHNPSWGPTQAAAIDTYIRSTFPHVADWDAAYDPSYFDGTDTPHPNETGRQALLALEDAAIATCAPAA